MLDPGQVENASQALSWSDPRILTAIFIGLVGWIANALNGLYTRSQVKKNRTRTNTWEEYRDTVYDPLMDAKKSFATVSHANGLTTASIKPDAMDDYFNQLNHAMGRLMSACVEADRHPESELSNWEDALSPLEGRLRAWVGTKAMVKVDGKYQYFTQEEVHSGLAIIEEILRTLSERLRNQRKFLLEG